ncbi:MULTISPECIES: hypothetical protein [Streptomyces]|uniref:Uncharacterized protein n=2 Tax=Streptomyces TaxID=1883 RepID=A0A3R7HZN7_9ACTN|nr:MULTISPECIES: hypothetical protein [Streptomyces]KNE81031.1 hypothetical protein ADZ36_18825 [Streptomyces fradiae]OFA49690.1 hypothetical protein BEN35_16690 [Streptomyces fradiae]PQM19867.1 hypothetical protein Sfr7A_30160 [Streptomyces xinghaiensis]RKM90851.1 hypothetical protein SFRA_030785 [Streptomyces xinghaiensis]RNC68833.1 hypothetical protein DC095_031255 [Streptomyces xinghaiensis]
MPAFALFVAVVVVCFEQLVESRFGAVGVVGMLMLSIGVKARNVTCSCVGAVMLALLLTR